MEPTVAFIMLLAGINLTMGFGFAVSLTRLFRKAINEPHIFFRYFAVFVLIYFLECVAFSAGMGTQVFSVGLAFVWGIAFGLWLRRRTLKSESLKLSFYLSIYSCLPTASFAILIPIVWLLKGERIMSAKIGYEFGIPSFVPWPINTILGFCTTLILGTVILKIAITIGLVSLIMHRREKPIS